MMSRQKSFPKPEHKTQELAVKSLSLIRLRFDLSSVAKNIFMCCCTLIWRLHQSESLWKSQSPAMLWFILCVSTM